MAQLREVRTCDKPARYYIDGKRVDKQFYEYFILREQLAGKQLNSFFTRAKDLGNGMVKRWNYSCI